MLQSSAGVAEVRRVGEPGADAVQRDPVPHPVPAAASRRGRRGCTVALGQQTDAWKSYNIATHNTVEDLKNADFPGLFENGAKAIGDFFSSAVKGQQAQNSIDNYTGALANLDKGQKQILQDADGLVRSGHSVAQSFALMDLAGVSASDSTALADAEGEEPDHRLPADVGAGRPAFRGGQRGHLRHRAAGIEGLPAHPGVLQLVLHHHRRRSRRSSRSPRRQSGCTGRCRATRLR